MIFEIDNKLLERFQGARLSDIVCDIMTRYHFISCRPNIRKYIETSIKENASTTHYELFKTYQGFSIPTNLPKYLTTINLSNYNDAQIFAIIQKPSWLLVENELNEWPVYKHMIKKYLHDRTYGKYYEMLYRAIDKTLVPHSCGGYGQFEQTLRDYNAAHLYCNTLHLKSCTLVDRDTNDETYYDQNKTSIYKFLSGKEINNVNELTNGDIFSLNQPHYIWHMWYKRAIENYFPKECFKNIAIDLNKIPDDPKERDYLKYDESIYNKKDLPKLTQNMSYSKYEENIKKFPYYGGTISELQLFLLKLVKII